MQPGGLAAGDAFGGVVEYQGVRVADEGGGQAQAAVHPAGELAHALFGQSAEADEVEDVVGAGGGDAGGGAEHAQMAAGGAGGVGGGVAQEDAEFAGGVGDAVQGAAAEEGDAAAAFELQHQAQGGGLARGGRAEEDGHLARPCFEAQVVDGGREFAAGGAGQSDGLDHRVPRRA